VLSVAAFRRCSRTIETARIRGFWGILYGSLAPRVPILARKSSHGRCSIEKSDDRDSDQNVRPPAKNPSKRKRKSAKIDHLTAHFLSKLRDCTSVLGATER